MSTLLSRTFIDQLGSSVTISFPPKRIVSLVPSQTELLFDLGLEKEVVGITKYCRHPASGVKEKVIIGGTKTFDLKVIADLQPDLIIGNKEENFKEGIEALRAQFPVWMSDIVNLQEAKEMIINVGTITGRESEAKSLINEINSSFGSILKRSPQRVLYLIWRKPWMAAGTDTFIDDMLKVNGWENAVVETRYPQLTNEQIEQLKPQVIFLSSEPYPFKEKHIEELISICPTARIILVDGEMFSWYGSRLRFAADYFNKLGGVVV